MCSYSTIDLKDLIVENDLSTIKKNNVHIHHGYEYGRTHNWQNVMNEAPARQEDVGVHVPAQPILYDFASLSLDYEGFNSPCPSTLEEFSMSV